MSLNLVIAMSRLMAGWPGQALDAQGTLRLVNASGTRQPLLWILNAAADTRHLQEAFGPDQPVIYGRSLHLLVPDGEDRVSPAQKVAEHYVQVLMQTLLPGRVWLGSNCQGNEIVKAWLPGLAQAGFEVAALSFVNNPLSLEATGLPALLIYGDADDRHNPFANDANAATTRARSAFSSYDTRVVAAGHGQYFSPPVVFEIASTMRAFWEAQPPAPDGVVEARVRQV